MINISDYQTLMLPVIKITSDNKKHSFRIILDIPE